MKLPPAQRLAAPQVRRQDVATRAMTDGCDLQTPPDDFALSWRMESRQVWTAPLSEQFSCLDRSRWTGRAQPLERVN